MNNFINLRLFFAQGFWMVSILFTFLDGLFTNIGCVIAGITREHYESINEEDEDEEIQ